MKGKYYICIFTAFAQLFIAASLFASSWNVNDFDYIYEVGPGYEFETPTDIPWNTLLPSTIVRIHWRAEPYKSKWVITTTATSDRPVVVTGVSEDGKLPVISGDDAVTPSGLYYLNEDRSIVKVGNYTGSSDTDIPAHIFIENLDIRTARPGYQFINRYGDVTGYRNNAAAVHIEEGDSITLKGCILHDCGNGLFTSHLTRQIVISGNYIYDNGIEGRYYEHNTYTESLGITYEYNHFGQLRDGCGGNNLKDRSAGTVIRYNWIEGGNRQLDLVDTDYESFFNDPSYSETFVYGNILIEPNDAGNSQIIHYGGDSGDTSLYRRGTLYFYHNTVISRRTGNTTLIRLSTSDVTADIRNNIIYTEASPGRLALTNGLGQLNLVHNWITEDYRNSFESTSADILWSTGNITGIDPGFIDIWADDFGLSSDSDCVDNAYENADAALEHPVIYSYRKDQLYDDRHISGSGADIGAYEYAESTNIYDLNGDGNVDILDVIECVNSVLGQNPLNHDLNGDGNVDILDVVMIVNVIVS
ncbi:putative polysaccharide-degrading enzyme [Desulfamplus magnetovallimortis]|uniref:Probable pectate lyase C n=1 Tax=Desulfamplus magnetovallimortis TaxID=1246637 RepID=A0A1W1HAF3_9BACT|nr:dockerin type I repeat-containing protein [Desulfamplus magnetovallimortis]SLM29423.1 putative polysaccharide-degrading enzyme [Desulfamplus magnetovallimortis]